MCRQGLSVALPNYYSLMANRKGWNGMEIMEGCDTKQDSVEKLSGVIDSLGETIKLCRDSLRDTMSRHLNAEQTTPPDDSKSADQPRVGAVRGVDRIENLTDDVKEMRDIVKMDRGKLVNELNDRLTKL